VETKLRGSAADQSRENIQGERMRRNGITSLLLVVTLGWTLGGCQDTKARQENDQLKARVAELEKENTDLGSKVDGLAKENSALASENERLKAAKTPPKKAAKNKHRKHKRSTSSSN
jgi:outer membrane murein-binding lipoprotein Lpp